LKLFLLGEHLIQRLQVHSLNTLNIDAAIIQTRQKIISPTICTIQLYLTDNGLLMPLDGEEETMTGRLIVFKTKFTSLIQLSGSLKGKNIKKIFPAVYFSNNYKCKGNYTIKNMKVVILLLTADIIKGKEKSIKSLLEKTISINANVPVLLNLFNNHTVSML
jgi:hypothetical protein